MSDPSDVAWFQAAKAQFHAAKYRIYIEATFESAHSLRKYFPDGSDEPIHGHSWKVVVEISSADGGIGPDGLAVDFLEYSSALQAACEQIDHGFINDHPDFKSVNPTTEHLCLWFASKLTKGNAKPNSKIESVTVWEGLSNHAKISIH